jgi:23S rRNA-/tRNA-specific pseudouridylate synthase
LPKSEIEINIFSKKLNLKAENISLDIIYEDKEIVIINKDS